MRNVLKWLLEHLPKILDLLIDLVNDPKTTIKK